MVSIDTVLAFGVSLVGASRGPMFTQDTEFYMRKGPPFWESNDPLPSLDHIKKGGMVCCGLTTLLRRKAGLNVELSNEDGEPVLGGTEEWFLYYKKRGLLVDFDRMKEYPRGTLLLQRYNEHDEGHFAVMYDNKYTLLHSVGWDDGTGRMEVKIDKGLPTHHFARYTHVVYPDDWLVNMYGI